MTIGIELARDGGGMRAVCDNGCGEVCAQLGKPIPCGRAIPIVHGGGWLCGWLCGVTGKICGSTESTGPAWDWPH